MKKVPIFASLTALAWAAAWAQPPEEIPPPLPESLEAGEVTVAPAPAPLDKKPALGAAPVAEPKAPAAPAAPEDKTVRGVTVTPGVTVYPIGYDRINIGEGGSSEGGRWFFSLKPKVDIASTFKTGTEKTIDAGAGYALTWREYYNKETTRRDFSNVVEGNLKIQWTDFFSTSVPVEFEHFYKAGADTEGDNAISIFTAPALGFKALPNLNLGLGLWMLYLNLLNTDFDPTNPPSDIDDLRGGSYATEATIYDSPFAGFYGLFPTETYIAPSETVNTQIAHLAAAPTVSFEPIKGSKLGFEYRFVFAVVSNDDMTKWKGHYLIPSVSQTLPWKGGSVALKDEVRLRKYDYASVPGAAPGTETAKQNFRNRLNLTITQEINRYMSFEAFYRWQLSGQNKDDYAKLENRHWFYTGVNFTF